MCSFKPHLYSAELQCYLSGCDMHTGEITLTKNMKSAHFFELEAAAEAIAKFVEFQFEISFSVQH